MEFERIDEPDALRLRIKGEFDSVTAPELRGVLDEIAEATPARVILDLSALRLIDSSGVGAIVSLFKRVRAGGGKFEVEGVQGQPASIFKVLRLDRVFDLDS